MTLALPKPTKHKKTRKRRARTARKATLKQCDKLFATGVRAVGRCEMDGFTITHRDVAGNERVIEIKCKGNLQCCHIVGRSYKATRWLRKNALCGCQAHHKYYTHHSLEWEEFVAKKYGPRFLAAMKRRAYVYTKPDYDAVLASLRECGSWPRR